MFSRLNEKYKMYLLLAAVNITIFFYFSVICVILILRSSTMRQTQIDLPKHEYKCYVWEDVKYGHVELEYEPGKSIK